MMTCPAGRQPLVELPWIFRIVEDQQPAPAAADGDVEGFNGSGGGHVRLDKTRPDGEFGEVPADQLRVL
ncbi:hypothetical protein ACFQZ4_08950 [Catellatospora coxensis]